MKKFVLLLSALVAMGLSNVWAYDFSAVAPSGQTLYYNIVDGNAQVTYQNEWWTLDNYSSLTGALEIPASVTYNGITYSVTAIEDMTFIYCRGLTSVTIPNSVIEIGFSVFDGTALYSNSDNWTDGVLYIGNCLIKANAESVSSCIIDEGTRLIASSAFHSCRDLTSVTIPESVISIGNYAFYNCSGLTSINIPNSVTHIGDDAFSSVGTVFYCGSAWGSPWGAVRAGCFAVDGDFLYEDDAHTILQGYVGTESSVTIPNSVTTIRNAAFANCGGLKVVTIPNSVTNIEDWAFPEGLVLIYCGSELEYNWNWNASYFGCFYKEGDFVFGDNTKTELIAYVGTNASVTIPSSVTYIGRRVFHGTAVFNHSDNWADGVLYVGNCLIWANPERISSSYEVLEGTRLIAEGAFSNCSGLMNVAIPNSVTGIGYDAFSGVESISYCGSATGSPWGANLAVCPYEEGDFIFTDSTKTIIMEYIGTGSSVIIPNTVTTILSGSFQNNSNITHLVIGTSVTTIEAEVFYNMSNLVSVEFNAVNCGPSIDREGYYNSFFFGCPNFTTITFGEGVQTIPEVILYNCSNLTSITIGSSVTSIGWYAFGGCSGLSEITSAVRVAPQLADRAFEGVNSDITINIPCNSLAYYVTRWSNFYNFVESTGFSIVATSGNPTMGSVVVLNQPSCSSPQAVVNAVATSGYQFDHWNNGETQNPYSLTLTKDTMLTAYFAVEVRDTVYVHDTTIVNNYIHDTTIVVDSIPYEVFVHDTTIVNNYIHDTTIVNNYIHDTTIVVDSIPYEVFVHDTTYIDVMIHDTTIVTVHDTIMEQLTYYTLTVVSGNDSRGLVAGNGRFPEGTEIEVAAIPIEGNHFVKWNDNNIDNPRRISLIENTNLTAVFEQNTAQGVADVMLNNYSVSTREGMIVVKDAEGELLRVFDAAGRLLHQGRVESEEWHVGVKSAGAYFVQVGGSAAQKVVVVR